MKSFPILKIINKLLMENVKFKKLFFSIFLGLSCLFLSSHSIILGNIKVYLPWPLIFPMLASLAFGPFYALVSCLTGVILFPFLLWPSNGWANILNSALLVSLIVSLGFASEVIAKNKSSLNLKIFSFVILAYSLISILLFQLLFNWFLSLNSSSSYTNVLIHIDNKVLLGLCFKNIFFFSIIALVAETILRIPFFRKLFYLKENLYMRYNLKLVIVVLSFSFLISLFSFAAGWLLLNDSIFVVLDQYKIILLFIFFVDVIIIRTSIHFIEGRIRTLDTLFDLNKTLSESESFRRRVFDESFVPIVVMDSCNYQFIDCNYAAVEIYNFTSKDDILGKTPLDVSAPNQYDGTPSDVKANYFIQKALRDGSIVFDWLHKRPNGETWDAQVHLLSFKSGDKDLLQFTLDDITERKIAEQNLKDSETKYIELFQAESDAILLIDNETGKILKVNNSAISMYGYSEEELLTLFNHDLSSEKEKTIQFCANLLNKQNEQYFIPLILHKKKDGTIFPVEIAGRAFILEGKSIHISAVRDITERIKSEEALKNEKILSDTIINSLPGSFFMINSNGELLRVNDKVEILTGHKINNTPGMKLGELHIDEDKPKILEAFNQALLTGTAEVIARTKIPDGKILCYHYYANRMDIDGKQYVVGNGYDITDKILAQEGLIQSENKYRRLHESIMDGYVYVDMQGKIIEFNDSYRNMLEYSKEELYNLTYVDITPEKWHSFESDILTNQIFVNGYSDVYEKEYIRKDGSTFPVELRTYLIKNDAGFNIGMWAIVRDISERKLAEETLRRSEEKFSKAFRSSPDIITITSLATGIIIEGNEKCFDILGYKLEEVIGKSVVELGLWADLKQREQNAAQMLRDGYLYNKEIKMITKAGNIVDILYSGELIELDGVKYALSILRDITEQKKASLALQKSEEEYRKLITTVPDLIIKTDLNGNIIFINETNESTWLYNEFSQVVGKNIIDFVVEDDRERVLKNFTTRQLGEIGLQEYKLKSKFGKVLEFEVNGNVLFDYNNCAYGMVFVLRDITERKKAALELELYKIHLEELVKERTAALEILNLQLENEIKKQKEAEEKVRLALEKEKELSDLKSKFISITSHEFRTPLTSIYSSTQLLERYGRNWSEEEFNKHIARVKKSVKYLTGLLDDVLTISRADSGKIKFEPKSVDLAKLCNSIVEDIKLQLTPKHNFNYIFSLNNPLLFLDEKLVTFIIINLISNAIKYSPKGGSIHFLVSAVDNFVQFTFQDQGIGIPKDDQQHLFKPFSRSSNVESISGSGLGLSIVKRSVDLHSGTINFESELNKGTKFIVNIPIIYEMKK